MNKIKDHVVTRKNLVPFILITTCFALWGFANDITNPMVAAFEKIFLTGATEATLVQFAFYGGYGVMAFPAALFIRKYTYKAGILVGLGLYAVGGLMFVPASAIGEFYPFLIAYFVITCGLSFLETSANPYVLSMGSQETATQRLNLAQAFNPLGSLTGMFVASNFILANLDDRDKAERMTLDPLELQTVKAHDLDVVSGPYIIIGLVIAVMFVLIAMRKMPQSHTNSQVMAVDLKSIFNRLLQNKKYVLGVVAQMFYVGAQIMCWTFIIHYGTEVFTAEGMAEKDAQVLSQQYNIVAMIIFGASRFICTFLLKYIRPGRLLMLLAIGGISLTLGTIFLGGMMGLYCLVGISACMSLMFPTIYGIALEGIGGDDAKIAAAGLIMAIVGGTFLPLLQASIIDGWTLDWLSGPRASFVLPLLCFVVIAAYGYRVFTIDKSHS
ncbi:L-fucose:H+ symporter permease [Marinoscillum furvescens]|uniref:FHS family L-fucose permease-like MFS transporter n=1 Tax=Marinoscillum furvescens DSM 4134 TaxID=1122208 RepID=A0A3D9KYV9_MARFU|nr:L-fucose:H+ symporter permease [Marinoscillum furvescens]RED94981.1 FHS family L-fucose permease-like MFS transporter [Marinoscillum furvescens DSM 4134]